MAETRTSPTPEDMHWGISYLREDLQDMKQDMRDFRKEVAQQFEDVRRDLRHNRMFTTGLFGLFATVVIAFIEYRLTGG